MVMVLTHRWDGRDEADVVSLLHPVARRGLVVREGVAVITCNGKDIYGLLFFFGPIFWSIFYAKDVKLDIMCNYSNNMIIFSWLTSSMRFVLWVDERVPFLCQNLVTEPEEDDVMLLARKVYWFIERHTYILTVLPVRGCTVAGVIFCATKDSGRQGPLVDQKPSHCVSLFLASSPKIIQMNFLDL